MTTLRVRLADGAPMVAVGDAGALARMAIASADASTSKCQPDTGKVALRPTRWTRTRPRA